MGFSKLPSDKAFIISPSDDSNLAPVASLGATGVVVYVGRSGQLRYNDDSDVEHVVSVSDGAIVDDLVKKVFSTDTTASDLLGIYKIVGVGNFSSEEWQLITDQWQSITPDTWN